MINQLVDTSSTTGAANLRPCWQNYCIFSVGETAAVTRLVCVFNPQQQQSLSAVVLFWCYLSTPMPVRESGGSLR